MDRYRKRRIRAGFRRLPSGKPKPAYPLMMTSLRESSTWNHFTCIDKGDTGPVACDGCDRTCARESR
jgi:hypothetical protein